MLLYAGARSVGRAFRHRVSGAYEARMRCARSGQHLPRHWVSGAYELRKRVRPFRAGSFSLNLSGDSPSADGGSVAAPAAGATPYPRRWAKRKDNLRFSFLFKLLPFPWIVWRRLPTCDRCEIGERQRIFSSVAFAIYSQGRIPFCYTGRLLPAGATYPCRAICERFVIDSTCEDK